MVVIDRKGLLIVLFSKIMFDMQNYNYHITETSNQIGEV